MFVCTCLVLLFTLMTTHISVHMKPLHRLCSVLVLDTNNSPREGSALHPNNEVQLLLSVNEGKQTRSGGQLQAVDIAPWLPVVLGRASLSQYLLGAEWASLGSSCQCWGGEGKREKAEKVEPTPWSIHNAAQGPVGCSIIVSLCVLTCVHVLF